MSPSMPATDRRGSFSASLASIAALASSPTTSIPRAASGIARRPVPTPSSSTGQRIERRRQLSEQLDRCVDIADVLVPVVVHVREGVAVCRFGVAIHRTIQVSSTTTAVGGQWAIAISLNAVHDGYTYLDHAATTPMRTEAVEAMLPFFTEQFANPSGSHRFARQVRKSIDEARDDVADVLGCRPGESDLHQRRHRGRQHGDLRHARSLPGGVALCPAVEHHAVLHAVEARHGRVVGVDAAGSVDLDGLAAALLDRRDVALVSVMAVNNEVGTITDLAEVAAVVRRAAPQAVLHTDAVQAACWLDLRTITPHVDLLSSVGTQVRWSERCRRADGPTVVRRSRRCWSAAVRNESAAAALTTSPASSPWRLRCGPPTTSASTENGQTRRAARRAGRRSAGRARRRSRDRRSVAQGRRVRARVHRRNRERSTAVSARRGGRVRQRSFGVRKWGDGAVARAGRDGRAQRASPRCVAIDARSHDDAATTSLGRRQRSSSPFAACEGAGPHEGARSPQRWRRLVGCRGRVDRRRSPCRRHHDAPVGWRERHGVLFGRRRRRCPPCRPAARHRPSRVQLLRRLQHARRRSVRPGAQRRPHAESVHRVQPSPEVRSAQRARRSARLRRDCHRPSRSRRSHRRSLLRAPWRRSRPRTRATSCTCCRSANCGERCSRSAISPRHRSATGQRRSVFVPRRSPTARMCASSRRPAVARRFSARASRSDRERWSTAAGTVLGEVPAIEMVTLGQRRGIGLPGGGPKRYVTDDRSGDVDGRRRRRGRPRTSTSWPSTTCVWADQRVRRRRDGAVQRPRAAQPAELRGELRGGDTVRWRTPQRRVAPGQSVVFFDRRRPLRPRRRHRPLSHFAV